MSDAQRQTATRTLPQSSIKLTDTGAADSRLLGCRLEHGLRLLLDGYLYARELGRDRWEFAVEMAFLHAAGFNNNDLRWLVSKGYAEHAIETNAKGKVQRSRHRAGRLMLPRRSCFVLTDAGVKLIQELLPAPKPEGRDFGSRAEETSESLVAQDMPRWDCKTHTLYWRGQVVKHFKHEAPFQEAILEAFHAESWSRYVVVILPKEEGVNPKERLRVTIKNLNRSCGSILHFTQEGNGGRVGWQSSG